MTWLEHAMRREARGLLLVLSGTIVWFGAHFPVAYTAPVLVLTLAPLLASSLRAPSAAHWRVPLLTLALLALPISWWVHAQPVAIGWVIGCRLAWSLALMATLANGRWQRPGWLGIDPRGGFLLAAGGMMPFLIPASNERAGTLAPFLPLAVAMLLPPSLTRSEPIRRTTTGMLVLVGALIFYVLALVQAGSRGGVLAAVGGCVAVLVPLTPRGHRLRALVWTATAALATVAILVVVPAGRDLVASILTDGSPRGVSWQMATSGRPVIWQRAALMIEDVPFTGLGLGAFGPTAAALYPLPFAAEGVLEDAHQFVLQTWLDLGPLGWIAIALLVVRALGIAWRDTCQVAHRAASRHRPLAAGLFGGLVAWTIFGLGDAVAVGTLGGVALWLFLGMVWTLEAAARPPRNRRGIVVLGLSAVLVLGLGAVSFSRGGRAALGLTLERNLASRAVYRSVLGGQPANQAWHRIDAVASASSSKASCHASWLAGALAGAVDLPARQAAHWRRLLHCDDRYLDVMAVAASSDRLLAHTAVGDHPTSARAWRWWAGTFGPSPSPRARPRAIAAWRRAASLAPAQGVAWRRLGDLLASEQAWAQAMDAYAAACTHGDPGANGCVLAAAVADHLGDHRQAAAFLRRSRWPPAQARADRVVE